MNDSEYEKKVIAVKIDSDNSQFYLKNYPYCTSGLNKNVNITIGDKCFTMPDVYNIRGTELSLNEYNRFSSLTDEQIMEATEITAIDYVGFTHLFRPSSVVIGWAAQFFEIRWDLNLPEGDSPGPNKAYIVKENDEYNKSYDKMLNSFKNVWDKFLDFRINHYNPDMEKILIETGVKDRIEGMNLKYTKVNNANKKGDGTIDEYEIFFDSATESVKKNLRK